MARYCGRHRAPSTTRRTLVRTALVGAVAGTPLVLTLPAAYAATDSTWDRLAQCESGGRWDINTGNGYHGGLQFSPRTWTGFGGAEFAAVAHQASRAEQIVVAERVLAVQGWGAWPTCSVKVGARGDAATARSAPAEFAPAEPAPAPKRAVAEEAPVRVSLAKAVTPNARNTTGDYVVRAGDTLSTIAAQNEVSGGWRTLVEKNPALAKNPNLIFPGQRITVF